MTIVAIFYLYSHSQKISKKTQKKEVNHQNNTNNIYEGVKKHSTKTNIKKYIR